MKKKRPVKHHANPELKAFSDGSIRFGYLGFLLGPLTLIPVLYYWLKTERLSQGSRDDKHLVSRAREGRNVGIFASIMWTLILAIQFGGGVG
jgi:hypothetical protein